MRHGEQLSNSFCSRNDGGSCCSTNSKDCSGGLEHVKYEKPFEGLYDYPDSRAFPDIILGIHRQMLWLVLSFSPTHNIMLQNSTKETLIAIKSRINLLGGSVGSIFWSMKNMNIPLVAFFHTLNFVLPENTKYNKIGTCFITFFKHSQS